MLIEEVKIRDISENSSSINFKMFKVPPILTESDKAGLSSLKGVMMAPK